MVYKFRILSDEEKDFVRDIELLSDQTFFDFHRALTHNLHYDKSQIASFYISNDSWEKLEEIALFDMSEDVKHEVHVMDKTPLLYFFSKPKERLLYVFDFFNERLFFIELIAVKDREKGHAYPRFTLEEGKPPKQLLLDVNPFEDMDFEE